MYMYVVMKDSNICRHICMCTIFNLYVYTHPNKYAHMFISGGVACWTYGHFEDPAVIGLGLPTEWWNHLSWCVTDWVSAVQHIGADPAYPASQRLVADWLIDWLIDGLIDWLIDGLMDWLIDWWIDGLIDWLINIDDLHDFDAVHCNHPRGDDAHGLHQTQSTFTFWPVGNVWTTVGIGSFYSQALRMPCVKHHINPTCWY